MEVGLEGTIIFHIEKVSIRSVVQNVVPEGLSRKLVIGRLMAVSIERRRVFLQLHLHRLFYFISNSLKLGPLILNFTKKYWTKDLGRSIVDFGHHSTIEDVTKHL